MKISIAGKDCTNELGPSIADDAKRRSQDPRCAFLHWSMNALSLADAKNEADYLDRFTALARFKSHVDTLTFDVPRRPGAIGGLMAKFKVFLWKLLRYQHDRTTFRQNLVNSNVAALIEFQRDEIRKLAARVADLERRPR